ncbi:MAG TPA: conjugal transfer protein [Streptosporangiaceae bacterium]
MELPTYTNIWRIEKRLYKLYDFRLPMPLPVGQIAVFAAITVPYVVILNLLGLPFSHTLLWLYILPPGVLAWLVTRPVLEGKRLPELVHSQVRYLGEPRTWCRMAPLAEEDEIMVVARVWRRARPDVVTVTAAAAPAVMVSEVTEIGAAAAGELAPAAEGAPAVPPRHWPEAPIAAWPGELAPEAREALVQPARPAPAAPAVAAASAPAAPAPAAAPAPVAPAPAAPVPAAREVRVRDQGRAFPVRPARRVPAPGAGEPRTDQPRRDLPAPAAPEASGADQARAIIVPDGSGKPGPGQADSAVPGPPEPAAAQAPPARPRPMVTVTSNETAERPLRAVERALGNPSERRTAGWHDHVVVVPGGHRPGRPDQLQRDRHRARLPVQGSHRVVVLGCTVGAGQTTTALLTGEVLASLRDEPVVALDLNPGPGSLAHRARSVPDVTGLGRPMPSRLIVITRETGGGPGAGLPDVTGSFEQTSARYPLTFADPGPAAVPRVLAAAGQLVLVAPASQDAASALATTREWLEAHGFAELADSAITVMNGVSRHTLPHVEHAESLVRGRCRAIVRVPWDDHLKRSWPERIPQRAPADRASRPASGSLSPATLHAYTALAGVLVAALATAPEQLQQVRR